MRLTVVLDLKEFGRMNLDKITLTTIVISWNVTCLSQETRREGVAVVEDASDAVAI